MSCLLLLCLACWAPDRDPAPREAAEDPPAEGAPETPTPPFSAWTSSAPTSIVGPGGETLALVEQAGVRVEVLRVLPHRMLLRCTGCPGPAAGVEGWLQNEVLWWPGAAELPSDHPLGQAQVLRARWAQGQDLPAALPPDVDPGGLCALLDSGYQGWPPRFTTASANLVLRFESGRWLPPALEGQLLPAPGACLE